jgi:hypothetical protein
MDVPSRSVAYSSNGDRNGPSPIPHTQIVVQHERRVGRPDEILRSVLRHKPANDPNQLCIVRQFRNNSSRETLGRPAHRLVLTRIVARPAGA